MLKVAIVCLVGGAREDANDRAAVVLGEILGTFV